MRPGAVLEQALTAEFGIVIRTNEIERCKKHLYAVKKDAPQFDSISIHPSRTDVDQILIIKNNPKLMEPDEGDELDPELSAILGAQLNHDAA